MYLADDDRLEVVEEISQGHPEDPLATAIGLQPLPAKIGRLVMIACEFGFWRTRLGWRGKGEYLGGAIIAAAVNTPHSQASASVYG